MFMLIVSSVMHRLCRTSRYLETFGSRRIIIGEPSTLLPSNEVSSRRFTWITFLPLSILLNFRKYSNCYLLMTIILMLIPGVSPLTPMSIAGPLLFVLTVSEVREFFEERFAYNRDKLVNGAKVTRVAVRQGREVEFEVSWHTLRPGHVVKVLEDQEVPADLVVLASSNGGTVNVETAKLDGETNLKKRVAAALPTRLTSPTSGGHRAWPGTMTPMSLPSNEAELRETNGNSKLFGYTLLTEPPNPDMYRFKGGIETPSSPSDSFSSSPLSLDNLILRGSRVKQTAWVIGVVAYAGVDSKAELNAASQKESAIAGASKQTKLDHLMNKAVFALFAVLLLMCAFCSFGYHAMKKSNEQSWYLPKATTEPASDDEGRSWVLQFFTFLILMGSIIPASMWIAIEVIRMCNSLIIDRSANIKCNSQNLHDDLGQITHLFTDKTGTLTANHMQFVGCLVGDELFIDDETEETLEDESRPGLRFDGVSKASYRLVSEVKKRYFEDSTTSEDAVNFFRVLALCHTCKRSRSSSPDEGALVSFVGDLGLDYCSDFEEEQRSDLEILRLFEFTSERRRMTVIARVDGEFLVLTKGADSTVIPRCLSSDYPVQAAVDYFCAKGLRTLVIGCKKLSGSEFAELDKRLDAAAVEEAKGNREVMVALIEEIESGLVLLGCTAVKDALQPGVTETLKAMRNAGIKISIITGDKKETALGVAQSCGLVTEKANVHIMMAHPRMFGAGNFVPLPWVGELSHIINRGGSGSLVGASMDFGATPQEVPTSSVTNLPKSYSVVVDGVTMSSVTASESAAQRLVSVVNHSQCEVAIFCRVSPKQKGQIIQIFRKYGPGNSRILSMGDGANDINMLRLADVGVGIAGREGSQAANAADYAIRSFEDVYRLLFHHGRLASYRLSNFVHIFFYKNFVFTMCQLWFAPLAGFSGTSIFDDWYLLLFNSCFGSIPFWLSSLSDHDVMTDQNRYGCNLITEGVSQSQWKTEIVPRLYMEAKSHFSAGSFLKWFADGGLHSVLIYFGARALTPFVAEASGGVLEHIDFSVLVYTIVVIVVSLMTLLHTKELRPKFVAAVVAFNFGAFFFFVYIYDMICRKTLSPLAWSSNEIFGKASFWVVALVLSMACLLPDIALRTFSEFNLATLRDKLNFARRNYHKFGWKKMDWVP